MDEGRDDGEGAERPRRRFRRPSKFTIALFVTVIAVGVIIGFLDYGKLWDTARAGDLRWVGASIAASAISYVFLAWSYGWIFGRMGIAVPMGQLMMVGYTSSALNHLMPVPTVAGHSLRVALLRDRGISTGDALAASAFHSYLSSFVLLSLFPIGLLLIVFTQDLPVAARAPLATLAAITLVLLATMTWLIFHGESRRRVLDRLGWVFRRFIRGESVRRNIKDFDTTIEKGIHLMKRRRWSFAVAVLLDLGDWVFTAFTLWLAFAAFGEFIDIGVLLTGFVVGIVVGLQSLIPGGIGLQEASMAGVYALLGVPFHLAILAALLFRLTYQILPFVLALVTYARLLHRPLNLEDLRKRPDETDRG